MAQVTKQPDDTYVVTLTAGEQQALKRWAADQLPQRTKAQQLEFELTGQLASLANDYRAQDAPKLRQRYEAATPAVQAQVDALLGVT
jgi:hypothetical protein